jgi:arsenate reductase
MANVLFVCVRNAGRSQIAQALFERSAGGRHAARSAGTRPAATVHAEVVAVLDEVGIDVSHARPRMLEQADAEWADVVVTMGCGDECPVVPGKRYLDWQLEDPAGKDEATVRLLREEIGRRVDALLASI